MDKKLLLVDDEEGIRRVLKSLKYQAIDFVTKPINDDVLENALNRAHEKIRMAAG